MEYLTHDAKFEMWPALLSSLSFFQQWNLN